MKKRSSYCINTTSSSSIITTTVDGNNDDDIKAAVAEVSRAFTSKSGSNLPIRKNSSSRNSNSVRNSSIHHKRRSNNLGSKRISKSINRDPNMNAIIIQKVIRGYLVRGNLLNIERMKLIKLLRNWGYGKVSTLQERKEVQDYNSQGLIRFASSISSISSKPYKQLPSKEKIRSYINGILLKQNELNIKHIIMKEAYISEHYERELMRHEDTRMSFIYCYENIINNYNIIIQNEKLNIKNREKDYKLKRQQWQMLQYANDKNNIEEGMMKLERELMFLEDITMTKIRKLHNDYKIKLIEDDRIRMIKEDMNMRTIHQELSLLEEQLQMFKYEANNVDRARREGRLLYGPLAKRYGSSINQRVNRTLMGHQYYGYDRYDLNITNCHYTPDSTYNKMNSTTTININNNTNIINNATTTTTNGLYNTYIDNDDSLKPHVFTSLSLAMPTVVKFPERLVERKVQLLAMLQTYEFFATIPYLNYKKTNNSSSSSNSSSQGSILPILYSNSNHNDTTNTNTSNNNNNKETTTTTNTSNNNTTITTTTPDINQVRSLFKCNILPHISCRVSFYKISSLKKVRLLRIDAFKQLVLVTADFVSKHKMLTAMR